MDVHAIAPVGRPDDILHPHVARNWPIRAFTAVFAVAIEMPWTDRQAVHSWPSSGTAPRFGIPVKAVRTHGRGGPEQLFFEDAPMPVVRPGDVLVRVRATGITPAELTWDETYQNADGRLPS